MEDPQSVSFVVVRIVILLVVTGIITAIDPDAFMLGAGIGAALGALMMWHDCRNADRY